MAEHQAVYATDEVALLTSHYHFFAYFIVLQYGRPFIILREQAKKTRTHGLEAIKVSTRRFFVAHAYKTSRSRTSWPQRQYPISSARLLDREVGALVAVYPTCTLIYLRQVLIKSSSHPMVKSPSQMTGQLF